LELFKCQSSADIRYIGHCYCNLGVIYCQFKQYDLALFCLEKQLKIQHKTLPVHHCEIGITYLNIGEVYEGLNFYNIALYYYEQSNEIFRYAALLPEHDAVVELQQHIQSTKMKLDAKNKLVNLMMLNK
jgi:tetratricopeptide (TPR) repeat protein